MEGKPTKHWNLVESLDLQNIIIMLGQSCSFPITSSVIDTVVLINYIIMFIGI